MQHQIDTQGKNRKEGQPEQQLGPPKARGRKTIEPRKGSGHADGGGTMEDY